MAKIGDRVQWEQKSYTRSGMVRETMQGEVYEIVGRMAHVRLTDEQQARLYGSRHWVALDECLPCGC